MSHILVMIECSKNYCYWLISVDYRNYVTTIVPKRNKVIISYKEIDNTRRRNNKLIPGID